MIEETDPHLAQLMSAVFPEAASGARPEGASVIGTLEAMPLTELIQNMEFAKRTARIDIRVGQVKGHFCVQSGQLAFATLTTTDQTFDGEMAVYEGCALREGTFRVRYGVQTERVNIERPTMLVLLDALRLVDEGNRSKPAPPVDAQGVSGDEGLVSAGQAADDPTALLDSEHAVAPDEAAREAPALTVLPPQDAPSRFRWTPRVDVDVVARFRTLGDETWQHGAISDLSIGGALVHCQHPMDVGARLQLRLRKPGSDEVELVCQVARTTPGLSMGVRFMHLTAEVAGYLAEILNDALRRPDERSSATAERASQAQSPQASVAADGDGVDGDGDNGVDAICLRDRSIYAMLGLDPGCSDGELESRCEALIESVDRISREARGRRADRLCVLHRSLTRLRPLWSDPIKRLRYDLRWGYVNAEARIAAAQAGTGVHLHILAGVWSSLYPERVREAMELTRTKAGTAEARRAALARADELDPFCRQWRAADAHAPPPRPDPSVTQTQRVPAFLRSAQVDSMPSAELGANSATQIVRGSLGDLPLRDLLSSMARARADATIEIRQGGQLAGSVGLVGGILVSLTSQGAKGVGALRALEKVPDGRFVVHYEAPPLEVRHCFVSVAEFFPSGGPFGGFLESADGG